MSKFVNRVNAGELVRGKNGRIVFLADNPLDYIVQRNVSHHFHRGSIAGVCIIFLCQGPLGFTLARRVGSFEL